MANKKHLQILESSVEDWNDWRKQYPETKPDLSYAVLEDADLSSIDLKEADMRGTELSGAILEDADLSNAEMIGACVNKAMMSGAVLNWTDASTAQFYKTDLSKSNLKGSWFCKANLRKAVLAGADLSFTDLWGANLTGAKVQHADLSLARLVSTNFDGADLQGCRVYGCAAWDVKRKDANQKNLIITRKGKTKITVDDMKVAQFIHLLLANRNIRDVINTVARKAVLILGRFSKKRLEVLSAIAEKLREHDLCPILFDFEKPEEQDIIETVLTLAGMCKFIIADVTNARVISDELRAIVPDFAIPVVPLFQPSKTEPRPYASLYTLYKKYDKWVLEPVIYRDKLHVLDILYRDIIKPAEAIRLKLNLDK